MLIGQLQQDVVLLALEQRMRLDVQHDIEAARRAAALARLAFARQADAHAVVHAGRDA